MAADDFSLEIKASVAKDLRPIPKSTAERILRGIAGLQREPFPRQSKKLTGTENLHRLRVGDYRIVYGVDAAGRRITVHYVRHRRDAYRDL